MREQQEATESLRLLDQPLDLLDGVIIYGTPEEVAGEIARLREEIALEYLLCAPLSHRSFELFTERVLPGFL